jgi:hypothetical protein
MEFWFGGELDHTVTDLYRPVRVRVEKRLNDRCAGRHYGDGVLKISICPMILSSEFLASRPERRLWKRQEKLADYRTVIDFDAFSRGNDSEREKLLVTNVLDAVYDLGRKAGASLDAASLVSDIHSEFYNLTRVKADA